MADSDNLPQDDQESIYSAREEARGSSSDCTPEELSLTPAVDPVIPGEACDDESETSSAEFYNPQTAPSDETYPDLLPDPLQVFSRQVSSTCVDPDDDDLTLLSGEYTDGDEFVVGAGADNQLVYLDDVTLAGSTTSIQESEVFRLASYITSLQEFVDENLVAAIDAEDFGSFDQGLIDIAGVSSIVAEAIRLALVEAQNLTDSIAQTLADDSIVCGYMNKSFWVVCDESEVGYSTESLPPMDDDSAVFVIGGQYTSLDDQIDADQQAAQQAALGLDCVVSNEEQTVSCSDAGFADPSEGVHFEDQIITWPTGWSTVGAAAATGTTKSLADQGAPWDDAQWAAMESSTEEIPLGNLNGQEFLRSTQVGTSKRRTLRTTVTVSAGDPRASASTLEAANEIARNLALADLDCFVPSRPRAVTCTNGELDQPTNGPRQRALSAGLTDDQLFTEMRGGDPSVFGGMGMERVNYGVTSFGSYPGEVYDNNAAFEVRVWPGFFDSTTPAAANDISFDYAAGLLQCVWVSPPHTCGCVTENETAAARGGGVLPSGAVADSTGEYTNTYLTEEKVKLYEEKSVDYNSLSRGLQTSDTYPGPDISAEYEWEGLGDTCRSALSCVYAACRIACCEPKGDYREFKANGMPNYATWGSTASPSTAATQSAFMSAWVSNLTEAALPVACDYDGTDEVGVWSSDDYDACNMTLTSGETGSIVDAGPVTYGAPARFKYGGFLPWGYSWAEPGNVTEEETEEETEGEGETTGVGESSLLRSGTVKACYKVTEGSENTGDSLVYSDPWGFYHCAEGYAEDSQVEGLGDTAQQLAVGRLDCTHVDWPRHMVRCPQPHQRSFGGEVSLELINEAATTQQANETSEQMLLALLDCQDTSSFGVVFTSDGGGMMTAPTAANVGGEDDCLPVGLSKAVLYSDCDTLLADTSFSTAESGHIFIESKCCEDASGETENTRILVRHIETDTSITADEIAAATGAAGIASGWAKLLELQEAADESSQFWYIASFYSSGQSSHADQLVAQVHTGPIMMDRTCCEETVQGAITAGAFLTLYEDANGHTWLQGGQVTGGNGGSVSITNIKVVDATNGPVFDTVTQTAGNHLYIKANCTATVANGQMLPGVLLNSAETTTTAGTNHSFTVVSPDETGDMWYSIGVWTESNFLPSGVGNLHVSGCIGNFSFSRI